MPDQDIVLGGSAVRNEALLRLRPGLQNLGAVARTAITLVKQQTSHFGGVNNTGGFCSAAPPSHRDPEARKPFRPC